MIILAIDPGTSCGFALGNEQVVIASGVWQLAPGRGESPGVRYLKLRGRLNEALRAAVTIDLVCFERSFQRGQAAVHIHHGLVTHLESWCAENRIEHANVMASSLKKWSTGRGNASKDQMRDAGLRRFKPESLDENEIDALWILEWAREQYGLKTCSDLASRG